MVGGGLWDFSVSPRPLGFGFWGFGAKGLGPGLDKNACLNNNVVLLAKLYIAYDTYSYLYHVIQSLELLSPFNNRQKFCLGPEENHQNCFPHDTNLKGFDELKLVSALTVQPRCALTFRARCFIFWATRYSIKYHPEALKQQHCIFIDDIQWTVLGRVIMMQVGRDGGPLPGQQVVISDTGGSRDWSLNTRDKERPSVSWDWPSPAPHPHRWRMSPPSAGHTHSGVRGILLFRQILGIHIQIDVHCNVPGPLLCQKMHKSECPGTGQGGKFSK